METPLLFRPLANLSHAGPEPASAADAWQRIEDFFADIWDGGLLGNVRKTGLTHFPAASHRLHPVLSISKVG